MLNQNKIPLKTFWETVKQRLAAYSAEELRIILRAMAQETAPTGRHSFLERLALPATDVAPVIAEEELLVEIDDLNQEIEETMQNADAWEEERYEWGDHYDDEDSLGPYEKFIGPLTALFDQVEAAFDYGNLALAVKAYQKLFALVGQEDDYGRGVRGYDLSEVDIGEAGARYLRACYETTPVADRALTLYTQMQQVPRQLSRSRLLLNDLVQITPRPLPDRERFLADWIAHLRAQDAPSGSDNDAWLREAVWLDQGLQGLATLARTAGQKHPRAYLDWCAALAVKGRHQEILDAAQQALHTLPINMPIRAAIADYVYDAATRLNQPEAARCGRWEAFAAKPVLARLLDLWEVATHADERAALMQRALEYMQMYTKQSATGLGTAAWGGDALESKVQISKSVLAHAYLLAGEWDAAQQLAAEANVLGWTSSMSQQGLVVAAFLVLLADNPAPLPTNLAQVWQWGLEHSVPFRNGLGIWGALSSGKGDLVTRLERIYATQFPQVHWAADQQAQALAWCLQVAHQRVDAIVGKQRRKSYHKAAILTVACAETLRLRGESAAARAFVDDVRGRFPRHSAFQREMKSAL